MFFTFARLNAPLGFSFVFIPILLLKSAIYNSRPDYGRTAFTDEDQTWEESMAPYKDAAIAGRQMFSCAYIYSNCPEGEGIMELISVLRNE